VAHESSTPAVQQQPKPEPAPAKPTPPTQDTQKAVPTSKLGIEKPAMPRTRPSFNTSHPIDISQSPETEPVHLIGDKKIDRPLLTLLGKALTKHLIYPKSALDLNVRGTAVIGFVLYPNGAVSDVQLLSSSRADVLDRAAISAASAIGPVARVGQYLTQPKFMVIGIIFQ